MYAKTYTSYMALIYKLANAQPHERILYVTSHTDPRTAFLSWCRFLERYHIPARHDLEHMRTFGKDHSYVEFTSATENQSTKEP